jgi:pre-mRNA branch site protein p14
MAAARKAVRLPPEVNRILYVRNLPYKITAEELYDIFGKYGAIRQIRLGVTAETKGTCFVVFEDIWDAKTACDHLSGFNVGGRYLVVLYYNATKQNKTRDLDKQQLELDHLRARVAAGEEVAAAKAAEAAAAAGDEEAESLDDEADKRLMRR